MGAQNNAYFWVSGTLFLSLFSFLYWLLMHIFDTRLKLRVRIAAVQGARTVVAVEPEFRAKSRRFEPKGLIARLSVTLQRADIELSGRDYLIRWLVLAIAGAASGYLVLGIVGSLLVFLIAYIGTRIFLGFRVQKRLRRLNETLPDMLTIVSNSLKAGHSFAQALHVVCDDLHGPLQVEMQKVEHESQIGLTLEEALARSAERLGSEDFDMIVTAIGIQRQLGGNLSEVLSKIGSTIRDRIRVEREVKMLTAQGRMSAFIFMILPIAIGVLLFVVNPGYMSVMFTSPLGWILLGIAACGQFVGFLFIRRIVRVSL